MSLGELPFPMPPFYFPTRVLHVDDHAHYLALLPALLGPRIYLESHTSARAAIRAAQRATERSSPVTDLIYRQRGDAHRIVLDVAGIHRIAYDPLRFSEISVVVADWHMPEMNGLDLLQQLPLVNAGRILLTGRADHATAVRAFNSGLIDRFVEKASPNIVEDLRSAILELQWSYFRRSFSTLADTLALGDFPVLRDTEIVDALQRDYVTINAIEMYVHDVPKGLLFLDEDGQSEFVVIMTADELFAHAERAEEVGAPAHVQRALRDGSSIPVFQRGSPGFDERRPVDSDCLIPATFVRGSSGDYFLGKLRDTHRFRLRIATITSYNSWLERVEHSPAASA